MVLYVLLAPYDNEQSDLLHRVSEEKKLEKLPVYSLVILMVHVRTCDLQLTLPNMLLSFLSLLRRQLRPRALPCCLLTHNIGMKTNIFTMVTYYYCYNLIHSIVK